MVAYLHSTGRGGADLLPSSGGFGVDIFFIISGFVIAFVVSKETNYFLIKRLFRIAPLYIIATAIMVIACMLFPEKINHAVANFPAFIKSILFIPYKIETKFEPSGPILGQGWTLNYEMFFYLIMTICIIIAKNKKNLGIICASVLAAIFLILNILDSDIFILKYYQESLFPEFIYGIILYYIYKYFKNKNKDYILVKNNILNMVIFGIMGFVSFAYMFGDGIYTWHKINNRNVYGGIPSAFLVFAFLNLENQINKENKFIKFCINLGDSSYALYLFHTFILMFFTRIVFTKIISNNNNLIISILIDFFIVFMTIIGSIIIYNIVDKPIQKYLKNVLKIIAKRHCT
jgi:peptidoglycan/LPS O-acetylase OafA/YrhL